MSATALVGDADANNRPVEEPQIDHFRVHAQIFRYMVSSLQDHFGETAKHRTPRLCLTYCGQENNRSEFKLLLCDCTHRQDSENGYQWQWRSVPIWITPDLVSRFLELEPTITDTNGAESFFRLQNREDKKLSRQFVLRELRTQLADVERSGIVSFPMAYIGTITLRHFLERGRGASNPDLRVIENRSKLILWCFLTRALVMLYKTSMMPRPWTEDTIEFMSFHTQGHGEGTLGIFPQFPMISAPVDPDPPEDDISVLTSRFDAQSLEGPKFPEIKALGVILLQIWLEMPMAQLSRQYPEFFENGTMTRMGQLNLCHSLDTGILRHLPEALTPLCTIIKRCFEDEVFEQETDNGVCIQIHDLLCEPLDQLLTA